MVTEGDDDGGGYLDDGGEALSILCCSVYSGLFAPSVQIPDCIWIEWMDRLQGLQCTTLI
uniref:Uncharacterized protein n=1 Tax=Aegilops tauschii TaxID=37682 RepID=M8CQM4_AEGTA